MDRISSDARSRLMAKVRRQNTVPELTVRAILGALAIKYRLHVEHLPGKPDIYIPSKRLVIFVHGCFWHGHQNCARASRPKSNRTFWNKKLDGNLARDRAAARKLRGRGLSVMTVWECSLRDLFGVAQRIARMAERADAKVVDMGRRKPSPNAV